MATLPGASSATRKRAEAAPAASEVAHASALSRETRRVAPSASLVPVTFFFDPPIATYAADCTTAKDSFILGEDVCVKVAGAPTSGAVVVLSDPDNFMRDAALPITASAQSFSFTLPSVSNSGGIDNRGAWAVAIVNTEDNSRRNFVRFFVHDPAQQVADVTITKIPLDATGTAGSNSTYRVFVTNQGPDAASNVTFTDHTLPNTTFVSFTQDDTATFTCAPGATAGDTTCTKASMAVGDTASFTAVYHVNAAASSGADLTDTVTVESSTFDSHESTNTSTVEGSAVNPNPPACTISCPANISQDSDPGQAGAIVNYTAPSTTGTCGSATTDHASGSFFPIGTTLVTTDVGNGVSCTFSVTVIDKRTVAVTLNGAADITIECRNGFTDPGATAKDSADNPLTVTATVTVPDPDPTHVDSNGDAVQVPAAGNVVDPNSPNTYTITYTATDSDGHTGKAVRVVHVVDTAPPVITLSGVSGFTPHTETVTVTNDDGTTSTVTETILVGTVECHDGFAPPSATAFDGCDNHSVPVTSVGSVDAGTPGNYEIIFRASDASGNDAEQRVRVTVVDTTGPVISLNGASPMTVECHTSFTDPGASASDACEGPVAVTASGSVDPNTVGSYSIVYTASDSGGRTTTVTRTVNVVDTTAPVVTLNGASSVTAECHTSYTDAGASATDSCSPTTSLSSSSDVNINAPGTYHVTWSATDPSGNTGTATRTVVVVDTIPPTLTLNSYAPSMWPANHKYQTFNLTQFVTAASDSCDTALGIGNVVIEKVTSDETENGNGDGNTTNDIVIASDCKSVQLRAERDGGGNGRVYTITFKVSDGANVTRKTTKVVVPHNPGETPVDSGVHYTVNGTCP
jgi:uncharacterized repeat protein (TIGR01451 family)